MFNFWLFAIFVHGIIQFCAGEGCSPRNATLLYVDHDNQFFQYDVEKDELYHINAGYENMRKVLDFTVNDVSNVNSPFASFTFIEERHPSRLARINTYVGNRSAIDPWDIPDALKGSRGDDNEIKMCCNPKMVIISKPLGDAQYRNLILNARMGQMFWIEEGLCGCSIKLSGMDGKNVREVYSNDKIYSFTHDNDLNQLYIATENNIVVLNLKTRESKLKALAFITSTVPENGSINVYSDNNIKNLVNVTVPNLPFTVLDAVEDFFDHPCQLASCAEYCVLGEPDENGNLTSTCMCPDCGMNELIRNVASKWNWLSVILLILFVVVLVLLLVEIKFKFVSGICR
ncbi:hypothetical protein M3Y97_00922900 [Aphelenchoides bicaudatus]|nr:hypothetical protein M3Y97_00922900 [Aphelenchoides bicaudatus]